ncbi:MAG: hypothetical protein HY830_11220 [Actinobacteria bacterium]|nr:hypothetical protein [Actinomycetota bacterium]
MAEHDGTSGGANDANDASGGLFDLRYLIGALFSLYGVVLVAASPFVDDSKADGLDMNLWLGLGMAALGIFFLGWARLRPLVVEGESALAKAERERRERGQAEEG